MPSSAVREILGRACAKRGIKPPCKRAIEVDLREIQQDIGEQKLRRCKRSELGHVPEGFEDSRIFWDLAGDQDFRPVRPRAGSMSEDEVLALQLARGLLAPPDDAGDDPLHRAFEGIMDRLGITPDPNAQEVAVLNHHRKERYQPDHLRELMRAIRTGRSITMQYASAKGRRAKVVVQPLCMVISEGEWFCYAWEPGPRRSKLFKVARIRSLRTGDRLAGAPAGASLLRSELRCAFRNSLGGARERVVVRFSRQAWPQVRDRVWGDDQQVAFIDDGLGEEAEGAPGAWHYGQAVWELSFVTEGLEAVRHWLLQFGAHVEAITPKHLRVWIASQSGMTYENHRDVDKPLFPPIKRPMTLINPACELDPEGILRFDG